MCRRGIAGTQIVCNVFVEILFHHLQTEQIKNDLLNDFIIDRTNSYTHLFMSTLVNVVQAIPTSVGISLATNCSVVQRSCEATIESISVYLGTTFATFDFRLAIVGVSICSIFGCPPSFLFAQRLCWEAQIICLYLRRRHWCLCGLPIDDRWIFIYLRIVDSLLSCRGMSVRLNRVEQWSRNMIE